MRDEPDARKEIAEMEPVARLCDAELERIGLSTEDRLWIHSGSDVKPTKELFEKWLAELRGLPTGMGAVAYCAYRGFDYIEMKASLGPFPSG